jgi:hypothetical protein
MRLVAWLVAAIVTAAAVCAAGAAEFLWVGMRSPCKLSGPDGLDAKQLDKKIGSFLPLRDADAWTSAIDAVHSRFPQARRWVTWAASPVRDAPPLTDSENQECLSRFSASAAPIDVFLELAPNRGDDVLQMIDACLAKLGAQPCVRGVSVDLEFYRQVDDTAAAAWDQRIKAFNPHFRLMLKHWDEAFMPAAYRGAGDLIFVNTSSEASINALNSEFADWARKFAPAAVAFQIGYPADEDGMDGDKTKGWAALHDPIRDWGDALLATIGDSEQEIGLLWVCAKSGKTYNASWDLTKPAAK